MRNFQSIVFIWTQTYTEIFKFALMYLQIYICVLLIYFLCMFFSSVKEIKRLISKGISSIYSKITIEKNWLQSFLQVRFWVAPTQAVSLNFDTSSCNLKTRDLGAKVCVAFLLILFWNELWKFELKSPRFCSKK